MSLLEATVSGCTQIEDRLRASGAEGNGLAELSDSISHRLSANLRRKLRDVAAVRNRFVHEHGYVFDGSESELLADIADILSELGTPTPTRSGSPSESDKGTQMAETIAWVRLITTTTEPLMFRFKWSSTSENRLVFFRGSVAQALPLGKHAIPLFSRISQIGYVRTAPACLPLETWRLLSKDKIPLDLSVALTLRVRADDSAIERVAADAMNSKNSEVDLARDHVLRAAQSLVSTTEFADLPDVDTIQQMVERASRVAMSSAAFDIVNITVALLQSSDPKVREAQLERLNAVIKQEQLKASFEFERMSAEARRVESKLDWKAEAARLDEQRQLDKKVAQDQLEIEEAARRYELKRLEMELGAKTKIAEYAKDAEVTKANNIQVQRMVQLVMSSAGEKRELMVLKSLLGNQYGISQRITDGNDKPDPAEPADALDQADKEPPTPSEE